MIESNTLDDKQNHEQENSISNNEPAISRDKDLTVQIKSISAKEFNQSTRDLFTLGVEFGSSMFSLLISAALWIQCVQVTNFVPPNELDFQVDLELVVLRQNVEHLFDFVSPACSCDPINDFQLDKLNNSDDYYFVHPDLVIKNISELESCNGRQECFETTVLKKASDTIGMFHHGDQLIELWNLFKLKYIVPISNLNVSETVPFLKKQYLDSYPHKTWILRRESMENYSNRYFIPFEDAYNDVLTLQMDQSERYDAEFASRLSEYEKVKLPCDNTQLAVYFFVTSLCLTIFQVLYLLLVQFQVFRSIIINAELYAMGKRTFVIFQIFDCLLNVLFAIFLLSPGRFEIGIILNLSLIGVNVFLDLYVICIYSRDFHLKMQVDSTTKVEDKNSMPKDAMVSSKVLTPSLQIKCNKTSNYFLTLGFQSGISFVILPSALLLVVNCYITMNKGFFPPRETHFTADFETELRNLNGQYFVRYTKNACSCDFGYEIQNTTLGKQYILHEDLTLSNFTALQKCNHRSVCIGLDQILQEQTHREIVQHFENGVEKIMPYTTFRANFIDALKEVPLREKVAKLVALSNEQNSTWILKFESDGPNSYITQYFMSFENTTRDMIEITNRLVNAFQDEYEVIREEYEFSTRACDTHHRAFYIFIACILCATIQGLLVLSLLFCTTNDQEIRVLEHGAFIKYELGDLAVKVMYMAFIGSQTKVTTEMLFLISISCVSVLMDLFYIAN